MRLLVTGGAGYIGSHTVLAMLEAGHDVVVLDNFVTSSPHALERVGTLTGRKVHVVERDVRDVAAVRAALEGWGAEAVVHFAGLKSVAQSVTDPVNYYDVNVAGTLALLRAMEEAGCSRLVFSSSATVYGPPSYLPYDEAHPTQPVNPYGNSKLAVERLLADWASAGAQRSVVSLRYFNPVGAHPSGTLGEDPKDLPNNLMPYITQVAVGRREFVSIFGDDYDTRDGTGERDYIHVMDLAEAHLAALEHVAKGAVFDVLNIGTGAGITVRELITCFETVTGCVVPTRFAARRAGDLPSFFADPSRASTVLNWSACRSIEDMCRDSWAWQKANPHGYRALNAA